MAPPLLLLFLLAGGGWVPLGVGGAAVARSHSAFGLAAANQRRFQSRTVWGKVAGPKRLPEQKNQRKKRLYLHIGTPKTGTSSFQEWLVGRLGDSLLGKALFSPTCRPTGRTGDKRSAKMHLEWSRRYSPLRMVLRVVQGESERPPLICGQREGLRVFLERCAREAGDRDLIVSSEILSLWKESQLKSALQSRDFFAPYDVHLIITARDPAVYLHKLGLQVIRMAKADVNVWGMLFEMRGAIGKGKVSTLREGSRKRLMSTCAPVTPGCIQKLAGMVGGGNVHVVSYEGMAAAGKDLKDILACGIVMVEGCVDGRLPGMEVQGRENVTPENDDLAVSAFFLLEAAAENLEKNGVRTCFPGTSLFPEVRKGAKKARGIEASTKALVESIKGAKYCEPFSVLASAKDVEASEDFRRLYTEVGPGNSLGVHGHLFAPEPPPPKGSRCGLDFSRLPEETRREFEGIVETTARELFTGTSCRFEETAEALLGVRAGDVEAAEAKKRQNIENARASHHKPWWGGEGGK